MFLFAAGYDFFLGSAINGVKIEGVTAELQHAISQPRGQKTGPGKDGRSGGKGIYGGAEKQQRVLAGRDDDGYRDCGDHGNIRCPAIDIVAAEQGPEQRGERSVLQYAQGAVDCGEE